MSDFGTNISRHLKQAFQHVDVLSYNCACMLWSHQICTFSVLHSLKCHLESSFSASLLRTSNGIAMVVIYMLQLIGSLHMSNYIWAVRSLFVNNCLKIDMYIKVFFFLQHQIKQTSNEWKSILAKWRTSKIICGYQLSRLGSASTDLEAHYRLASFQSSCKLMCIDTRAWMQRLIDFC